MPKVLAKAGDSLADVYDVEGSIAGVDELQSRDVHLFHEMGSTIFSERLGGTTIRMSAGALAQNTTFDLIVPPTLLPTVPFMMQYAVLLADVSLRTEFAAIMVRDLVLERELPFLVFDANFDSTPRVRVVDSGAAPATQIFLKGNQGLTGVPMLLTGRGQPSPVGSLAVRGLTSAFGAGTVTIIGVIYLAFAQQRGVSSRGLPVPSWG